MKVKVEVGVKGIFSKIEVLGKDGKVKREIGEFSNLITDIGLQRMASSTNGQSAVYSFLRVSTDTTEPSTSDTGLQGQVASTSSYSHTGGVNMEEGYAWRQQTWTFPLGAIDNQNISKLATGWGSGEGTVFSVALVKDSEGNPTTVTVLEDEQLRVSWEHRRYWPTEDTQSVIANEGNKGGTFTCTARAAQVGSWAVGEGSLGQINIYDNGVTSSTTTIRNTNLFHGGVELGGITSNMEGASFGGINLSGTERETGDFSTRIKYKFSLSQANDPSGIGGIKFGSGSGSSGANSATAFQIKIDPPIMKTSDDLLEIGVEISWQRT